jgi:hypothetical protein
MDVTTAAAVTMTTTIAPRKGRGGHRPVLPVMLQETIARLRPSGCPIAGSPLAWV